MTTTKTKDFMSSGMWIAEYYQRAIDPRIDQQRPHNAKNDNDKDADYAWRQVDLMKLMITHA